LNFGKPR